MFKEQEIIVKHYVIQKHVVKNFKIVCKSLVFIYNILFGFLVERTIEMIFYGYVSPFDISKENITEIVNLIINKMPNTSLEKKIEFLDGLTKKLNKPEYFVTFKDIINKQDEFFCPLWFYLLREKEFDVFNYYKKKRGISFNVRTLALFLSSETDPSDTMDWFPKSLFEKAVRVDLLQLEKSYLLYGIHNDLFKNYKSLVKNITVNLKDQIFNFRREQKKDGSIYVKFDTINLFYNHYYDLFKDEKILKKAINEILDVGLLQEKQWKVVDDFSGVFRGFLFEEIFNRLKDSKIQLNLLKDGHKILKEMIDQNMYIENKDVIYKSVCSLGTDLLAYAIVKNYFSKEDLVRFNKNEELQADLEKAFFDTELTQPQKNKKIKL